MEYDPASRAEMNVFGEGAKAHPITGMALETGLGCLSDDQQAHLHCNVIEHHQGKEVADEMRARVQAHITARDDTEKAAALDQEAERNKVRAVHEKHVETLKE